MTLWVKLFGAMPVPNVISFFRGICGLLIPFFILADGHFMHVLAFIIFVTAAVTDYLDGWVARRYGMVSDLGKITDPTMDKLLILAPMAAFVRLGYYSVWWVVPIFIREILVTFCRIGWIMEKRAIGAEKIGKLKFVSQVGILILSFLSLLARDLAWLAAWRPFFDFMLPGFLVLALVLTVASGISVLISNRALFRSPFFARFVSALGVGLIPRAPGTWGSLAGLVLVLLAGFNGWLYGGVFLFLLVAGYGAISRLDLSKSKDPSYVVIDEACGIFVTFAVIPLHAASLAAGFFLFRLFDILKPSPLRLLERLPGFWGIMMDDLGAGLYAWVIMFVLFHGG